MTTFKILIPSVFISVALLAGCKGNDKDTPAPAAVKMSFQHTLRGVPVTMGSFQALNDSEQVQVNNLRYYLSNFRFKTATGKAWAEPDSYHLVESGSDGKASLVLKSLPPNAYTSLEFYFGVDNGHNNSLDWVGDLDPIKGMAWDWVTGYKFLLLEGNSRNGALEKPLVWHVGLNSNFRRMNRSFASAAVKDGDTLRLNLVCPLDSLFMAPNSLLPLTNYPAMHGGATPAKVADNFAAGFLKIKP